MSSTESAEAIEKKPEVRKPSQLKSLLSGGFGGVCLVFVGHPFDLIKVRLQTASASQYKGAVDCFKQTVAKDGVRGLYRGMGAPLTGITPIFSICFWGYDIGERIARWAAGTAPNQQLSMTQVMFAGGFSAIPTTAIMAPGERIKVVLQIQGQNPGETPKFKGPIDVIKHLYKEGGIRSIFRGTNATLLRDVPGSVAWFGVYEYLKRQSGTTTPNPFYTLFAGGMAGIANWLIAIPADVIKSRFQTAPQGKYSGVIDVTRDLLKEQGVKGLYKGVAPALLRAFPANAACFFGVELARSTLDKVW
eukprot:TRINITY_DN3890_c0_g1_i1.p1 TRINITY_DN3890_c0_g1~~TRINITY_DN3890_c0_g1_i1.p1  ORF type:complete len:304 (-),score=75.60 TRINITY_DN3890_c0_g1_i1:127-1038(-)